MKKTIIGLALLALIGAPAAIAQNTKGPADTGSTINGNIPQAPIGHRQPRASDVPSEKNLSDPGTPVNKEDALLDKKIKSICRGC
jgi:hypothetical protein